MPYAADHKQRSREKILRSALELFSRHGFDAVSIDELMADAGFTRGAFYAHFSSKSEVYAEAIGMAVRAGRLAGGQPPGEDREIWLQAMLQDYLSPAHVAQEVTPCPLAFFSTDVATRDSRVRRAYTEVYAGLNRMLSRLMSTGQDRRADDVAADNILAATAMMIGGVSIARALDDDTLSRQLLASCRHYCEALFGEQGNSDSDYAFTNDAVAGR